jgi:hypothetical protein
LLVCSEFFKYDHQNPDHIESRKSRRFAQKYNRILSYDMTNNKFLKKWLKNNEKIIPVHMGGLATTKNCPRAFDPGNIRAAGWFRKIVSLNYALEKFGSDYDVIIFVDSDCIFKKNIDSGLIKKAFGDSSCFYHLGEERKKKGLGVESGFVGFRNNADGYGLLSIWISKYKDGSFERYDRWDDGGMLRYVLEENTNMSSTDLVRKGMKKKNAKNKERLSHVVEKGIFKNYLEHYKGLHKNLGIGKENKFKKLSIKEK